MTWLRHVAAIGALPFVAAILIPVWLARSFDIQLRWGPRAHELFLQLAGLLLLGVGLLFFVTSVARFANEGRGTLAPWDPPRKLVVRGLYRYVRNPMISGVVLVLAGEALLLLSLVHAAWAALFTLVNAIYIPLVEEPGLERRFGESYRRYCDHVPRILPRLRPWERKRD